MGWISPVRTGVLLEMDSSDWCQPLSTMYWHMSTAGDSPSKVLGQLKGSTAVAALRPFIDTPCT